MLTEKDIMGDGDGTENGSRKEKEGGMSWADKQHRKMQREQKRQKDIFFDGQVFYDVYVLGTWRTLRRKGYAEDNAEEIINESMQEMFSIYENPGDYHRMCVDETGIEVVME